MRKISPVVTARVVILAAALTGCGATHTLQDPCPAAPPASARTVLANRSVHELALAGNKLVYVDELAGVHLSAASASGAVFTLDLDGTHETQLYAPSASDRIIADLRARGSFVYVLEHQQDFTVTDHLLVIPVTGGSPTDLILTSPVDSLIDVDAGAVYAFSGLTDAAARKLLRIDITSGATTEMAAAVNLTLAQLNDGALFYATQTSLGSNADRTISTLAVTGTTPALLSDVHCAGAFYSLANGFLCAGYFLTGGSNAANAFALTKTDSHGAHATLWADFTHLGGTPVPVGEVEGSVYVLATGGTGSFLKLDADAGHATAIACKRNDFSQRTSTHRPEVVVGDIDAFWIEGTNIFAAAR